MRTHCKSCSKRDPTWQGPCSLDDILRLRGRQLLLAIPLALGIFAATDGFAQPSGGVDEYLCLRGAPSRHVDRSLRFTPRNALALRDRLTLASGPAPVTIDLRKALGLCLPAGGSPLDAATHLEIYGARLARTRPAQTKMSAGPFQVTNRFGTDVLRVKGIEATLEPSAALFDPPPAPVSVPGVGDAFSCYAAEHAVGPRGAPASEAPVTVVTGLGSLQWDVRAPEHLCVPADIGGTDAVAPAHATGLACYRAKLTRTRPPQASPFRRAVALTNRFGAEMLALTTALEFCVPSTITGTGPTPTPGIPTPTPTVTPPPGFTLRIDPASATVDIGQSAHFTASALYDSGDIVDFTERVVWSTNNTVAVAPNAAGDRGRIEAIDGGQAVISVLDEATGVTSTTTGDDATLTVNWTLERVELLPEAITRGQGETFHVRALGHFAGGYTRVIADRVTYASTSEGVAEPTNDADPDDHSVVLAVSPGTATISAVDPISGISSTTSGDDVTVTVVLPLERCKILQTGPIKVPIDSNYQLTAHGFYPGGFERVLTQQVVWTSDKPAVLEAANPDGHRSQITGLDVGEAHVTAQDPVTGTVCEGSVQVLVGGPFGLFIYYSNETGSHLPKRLGYSWHLRALATFGAPIYEKYVTEDVVWTSSDPSVVAAPNVPGDRGRLDSVGGGSATITAHDPVSGLTSQGVTLHVLEDLTRVQIFSQGGGKFVRLLSVDEQVFLQARGLFRIGGTAILDRDDVTFVSDNPSVVQVARFNGIGSWYAKALAPGTATIDAIDIATGISSAAFGESLRLGVRGALERIELVPTEVFRRVGGEISFAAIGHYVGGASESLTQQLQYYSSNPNVAAAIEAYPSRSRVVAVGPGTALITATDTATGFSTTNTGDDALVTVLGPLQSVRVQPPTVTRSVGRSFSFTAIGTDASGHEINITQDVVWTASHPAIASASNPEGNRSRVDTHAEGVTTIAAWDPQDNVSSTSSGQDATFTVSGILQSLTLAAEQTALTVGGVIQLTATGHLVGGTSINLTQQVFYVSSNPSVAKATNTPGDRSRILALKPGTAVISATDPGTGIATTAGGKVTLTVSAP